MQFSHKHARGNQQCQCSQLSMKLLFIVSFKSRLLKIVSRWQTSAIHHSKATQKLVWNPVYRPIGCLYETLMALWSKRLNPQIYRKGQESNTLNIINNWILFVVKSLKKNAIDTMFAWLGKTIACLTVGVLNYGYNVYNLRNEVCEWKVVEGAWGSDV